ncbi:MAG: NUDIX domain-containing protein, partial [Pirellulaceae bacterium]
MQQSIAQAFRFCPRCGTESLAIGEVPFHCDQCDFTFFFGPVSAVGGLIPNEAGHLLLLRRARDPGKGKLGLPGGFVDPGESAEEALRREIAEEVRLEVEDCQLLVTFPNQYTYKGFTAPVLDLFFICQVDASQTLDPDTKEVHSADWRQCDKETLDQMAFES